MSAVLLIIDMQNEFLKSEYDDRDKRKERINNILEMIKLFKKKGWYIVNIKYGKSPVPLKIKKELVYKKTINLTKNNNDAFKSPEIKDRLFKIGFKNLVLAGMFGDACVYETFLSAKKDFNVLLSKELLLSYEEKKLKKLYGNHLKGLKALMDIIKNNKKGKFKLHKKKAR